MIDLKAARAHPDVVRAAVARKGGQEIFDALLAADEEWRAATARQEELRAEQKRLGKPSSEEEIERARSLKAALQEADDERTAAEQRRRDAWDRVPNPPDMSVPDGSDEEDAVEIRSWGEKRDFGFEPLDHLDIATRHGWIDMERASRLSGTRFVYRLGDFALTELALYRFALDRLAAKGFVPVLPPVLVREQAMYGTGFLPTDEVNIYRVERDDLYLTGTSEVALAALHMDEILAADDLPLRYAGYSTCFRREAGAAGKDTRGMFRVHQFDKVEMFSFVRPEDSPAEHEHLLAVEEELVQELGIPYRVVNVAAGDLGLSASKKYDIEAWFPGQGRYREITSTSNTTDFQARRLQIRYRPGEPGPTEVHTLNGTAVTARSLIAIVENFQDEDGSVAIPSVLERYGAPSRVEAAG
jgi:seryl-tRNA synthetase